MGVSGCSHSAAAAQVMAATSNAAPAAVPTAQAPAQTATDTVSISPEALAKMQASSG